MIDRRSVRSLVNRAARAVRSADRYAEFRKAYSAFARLSADRRQRFALRWEDRYPCLDDNTVGTAFDRHYVYHTAWAVRRVLQWAPQEHVDISSSLYFAGLLSASLPVRFYDYRPAALDLSGLTCASADLAALPFESDTLHSLSCMHVVEHVGLGRYGDPLDPDGDLRAMAELSRVLARGGALLFVAPVGRPRVQFNAHRVYAAGQIIEAFSSLELAELSLVPDDPSTGLIENAPLRLADEQVYGCGCFRFIKP